MCKESRWSSSTAVLYFYDEKRIRSNDIPFPYPPPPPPLTRMMRIPIHTESRKLIFRLRVDRIDFCHGYLPPRLRRIALPTESRRLVALILMNSRARATPGTALVLMVVNHSPSVRVPTAAPPVSTSAQDDSPFAM